MSPGNEAAIFVGKTHIYVLERFIESLPPVRQVLPPS